MIPTAQQVIDARRWYESLESYASQGTGPWRVLLGEIDRQLRSRRRCVPYMRFACRDGGSCGVRLRQVWARYLEVLADPTTRFPVLVLTVVMLGCWAVIVYILLTAGLG